MKLTESNCSVDKSSGAVLYHKSPELKKLMQLEKDMKDIYNKLEEVLELLKGVDEHD